MRAATPAFAVTCVTGNPAEAEHDARVEQTRTPEGTMKSPINLARTALAAIWIMAGIAFGGAAFFASPTPQAHAHAPVHSQAG
jgi:hypothetical protein